MNLTVYSGTPQQSGVVSTARSITREIQKPLVITNQTHIGESVFVFEAVVVLEPGCQVNMESILMYRIEYIKLLGEISQLMGYASSGSAQRIASKGVLYHRPLWNFRKVVSWRTI